MSEVENRGRQKQTDRRKEVEDPELVNFRTRMQKEEEKVKDIRAQMEALTEEMKLQSETGKEEYKGKRREIGDQLEAAAKEIDGLEEARKALQKTYEERIQRSREARDRLQGPRKAAAQPRTGEEIKQKIRELEHKLMTSNLDTKTEKDIVGMIQRLRKEKPASVQSNVQADDGQDAIAATRVEINMCTEEIRRKRQMKSELNQNLQALIAERQAVTKPAQDLWERRDVLRRQLEEVRGSQTVMTAEFNVRTKKQKQQKEEARRADLEAAARDKIQLDLMKQRERLEKKLSEIDNPPVARGIAPVTRTLQFIKTYLAEDDEAPQAAESVKTTKEEDYLFPPTHVKTVKHHKKKARLRKVPMTVLAELANHGLGMPRSAEDLVEYKVVLEEKLKKLTTERDAMLSDAATARAAIQREMAELDAKAAKAGVHL